MIITLAGCVSVKNRNIVRQLDQLGEDFQEHTGFYLMDPSTNEILVDFNGARYFTPASNTKIFTMYAALELLGESLPGLYYKQTGDSLIFWGSGDPAFLYPLLPQGGVFQWLSNSSKKLYYSPSNFYEDAFGPGWAWDDYNYTYSVERTPFPMYGNAFVLKKKAQEAYLDTNQPYFKRHVWLGDSTQEETVIVRDIGTNKTTYFPSGNMKAFEHEIPFRYDDHMITAMLSDTLKKEVGLVFRPIPEDHSAILSIPTDSALKVMMQESDNFIAEQLLLVCSGVLNDSLQTGSTIDHAKATFMKDMPDTPIWRDGSGLSRYNLFTPRSIVWLWQQMLVRHSKERLFPLLATGGKAGTIKNYYKADPPYIFGKTGTLSNNHALSGYLVAKSGRLLVFSFMNSNYTTESYPLKKRMEKILWEVREKY
ncbi:D-alanyl-D-alanine carboxypeptidase/D-alanyl-D-alanine-endopeptidase [Fulvivirga sp. M361]|uniref:D-alanyl-D-alanine carboxypeptidase/D-alanyl-D-alanine-endopeptidase n=1 Tax=Fulvivirga sp. M361 TaxID=2594266 RepID=UPI001624C107|nr:D-alanyl-D-alanine carboxypeptidase [Fulvivirga sp. M361]